MSELSQERKLPVMTTVSEVLEGSFSRFGNLISIAWFPLLLTVSLSVGLSYLLSALGLEMTGKSPSTFATWISGGAQILVMLLFIMITVGWCRRILLEESPKGSILFQFGKREVAYLGYLLLLIILFLLSFAAVAGINLVSARMFGDRSSAAVIARYTLVAIGLAGVGFVYFRTILVLPAMSVSEVKPLRAAWRISKGNCWRLFWSFLLINVAILIALGLVGFFFAAPKMATGTLTIAIVSLLNGAGGVWLSVFFQLFTSMLSIYFTMIGVLYLSSTYRYLTDMASVDVEAVFGDVDAAVVDAV